MRTSCFATVVFAMLGLAGIGRAAGLEEGFAAPGAGTKPWVYWYWISDNVSREGITRDLEAMSRVGIGEALIGNIFLDDVKAGSVKVLSDEWWGLVEHAIREGGRTGVNIGMFNSPGWSQSGGPWVKPQQAMRYLASWETRVVGPAKFEGKLPAPAEPFQQVAVQAFPAPQADGQAMAADAKITCTPAAAGAQRLLDGKLDAAFAFPRGGRVTIDIEAPEAFTARSLSIHPTTSPFSAKCELLAQGEDGSYRSIRTFRADRSNMAIGVGPMPRGPVTVALPATTSRRFRIIFSEHGGNVGLAELTLSGAARLELFVEKQLGKMHPTPLPMWETYLWPTQPEPDSAKLAVERSAIRDLSSQVAPDGTLKWDVPAGEWVIVRTGMTPTGTRNGPASPEGQGLEVDKMNREALAAHFDAFIGKMLARIPAAERKAFTRVVADSYEMGSQNWTDGFAATFAKRYGYDPIPFLPVLTGRMVGSADQSERFLWDLRRLVADQIARDYVGGLRDLCRPHGLQLWLENYGHWGFPSEFLMYGGASDRIGGEFWVTGDLGSIECRAASSAANTYGKPIVSAEAFTGGPAFQNSPRHLKARGDWAFCEGVNHFVLHVYIHQPWEERVPGVNAWFGTEFNRHNTWFEPGKAWVDYLRRCCHMLQQGTRVADVAYFIGEDAPKMTGIRKPALPAGRDFDYINAEVILEKLTVRNGRLVLPHGTSYRVLVLPDWPTMRPAVLKKIGELVRAGATVVGTPPTRSPSLENYPRCDDEVKQLAAELWGEGPLAASGERKVGQGRIIWGRSLEELFAADGVPADFASEPRLRFTHRSTPEAEIYFIANPKNEDITVKAAFRVTGKAPEIWRAESGQIERPAVYEIAEGVTKLPLNLGPHGSAFVVFREPAPAQRIVAVKREGRTVLDTAWKLSAGATADGPAPSANFTFAVWANPSDQTTILPEANAEVRGMAEKRNDALFPPHGNTFPGEGNKAGSGLAVGRNGVAVFEHGASYFCPILVHPAAIEGWTHIAVVYRENRPTLYVNGKPVRTGLQSRYTVFAGSPGSAGGSPFHGQIGTFEQVSRAMSDEEVAALAQSMPRPGNRPASSAIQVMRSDEGKIEALAWEGGAYQLVGSDGSMVALPAVTMPEAIEVSGPWEVQFEKMAVRFDKLVDWTQRPEDAVRHFSGRATYRKTIELPEVPAGRRLYLDLGSVRDLAVVRVNGQEIGMLWNAPWQIEITRAVRAGANQVEIDVVNPWNNRVVGDLALPEAQRHTFLLAPTVRKGTPLLEAGLLGPVFIRPAVIVDAGR